MKLAVIIMKKEYKKLVKAGIFYYESSYFVQ